MALCRGSACGGCDCAARSRPGRAGDLDGEVDIAGETFEGPRLLVFRPGDRITVLAPRRARLMFLGGAALEGPRYIWWNFVSSRRERIEQAKEDWKMGRFTPVPGETEFIPLPET
jgi:Pirin C-terminal cupin domain